jgi:hypothetical protein
MKGSPVRVRASASVEFPASDYIHASDEAPSPGTSHRCGQVVGRSDQLDRSSSDHPAADLVTPLGALELARVDAEDHVGVSAGLPRDLDDIETRCDPARNRRVPQIVRRERRDIVVWLLRQPPRARARSAS